MLTAAFVSGLGPAAFITGEITLLQTNIPAAGRGRVIALTIVLATAVGIVAISLGGWLADHTQVRTVMLIASLVHIAIGGCLLSLPHLRDFYVTTAAADDDLGIKGKVSGRLVAAPPTSQPLALDCDLNQAVQTRSGGANVNGISTSCNRAGLGEERVKSWELRASKLSTRSRRRRSWTGEGSSSKTAIVTVCRAFLHQEVTCAPKPPPRGC